MDIDNYFQSDGGVFSHDRYCTSGGKPLKDLSGVKTKSEYPYSYDPFLLFDNGDDAKGSVYTDRLFTWDSKKHDELCFELFGDRGQYWESRDPGLIQSFLRSYLGEKDLVLTRIIQYCNVSSGYPVWRFDYN